MKISVQAKIFVSMIFVFNFTLMAEISDSDKVKILTDYLVKEKSREVKNKLTEAEADSLEEESLLQEKEKITIRARNEAVATIYGKPVFQSLVYDDDTEMFFGRVVSQNGNFEKEVNFYMPKQRARTFKKNLDSGRIEIEHLFDDNEIVFKEIELNYEGVNYPLHVDIPNTFTLKLGGYFIGAQDTIFSATKNGIGGTLNLQELFDMESEVNVLRVSAAYKFNPKHKIEASFYSLKSSSEKTVETSFEYNGETINAGAALDIYFNTDVYKVNYVYSAYRTNKLEFMFRAGLHITALETGLNARYNVGTVTESAQTNNISITAPLPVVGLGFDYEIMPKLNINYTVDYFLVSYNSTVSGSMSDSILSLDYTFSKYIGVGAGFNRTQMNFKAKDEDTVVEFNNDVAGLLGYVIFSY